jgi:hypothetical protein
MKSYTKDNKGTCLIDREFWLVLINFTIYIMNAALDLIKQQIDVSSN